jgi:hypothetical protein
MTSPDDLIIGLASDERFSALAQFDSDASTQQLAPPNATSPLVGGQLCSGEAASFDGRIPGSSKASA